MIEITQHIEQLLLHHDCVIVPGLGGFVAQNCSARYVEEEGIFLPPYRSVTFNPRLTMNDGLLVQNIAQVHGISFGEAQNYVQGQVDNIRRSIQEEGHYTFYGVGRLSASQGNGYEFKPEECGIASPQWFGLDSFEIDSIAKEETKPAKVEIKQADEETYTVNVHVGLLRYAAVAAVAAVFFFLCIAPIKSAFQQNVSEAGMFHQLWSLVVNSPNTTIQKEAPSAKVAKTTAAVAPSKVATPAAKNTSSAEKAENQEECYTIVVAASVSKHGANAMIKKWKENGKGDLRIIKKGQKTCVAYGKYSTEKEARSDLKNLSQNDSGFEHAWVYHMK